MSMKLKPAILIICAIIKVSFVECQDWCDIEGCEKGSHIACNNHGDFSSLCRNPQQLALTQSQIGSIIDGHNSNRNSVASGKLSPLPTAKQMAKLVWNEQLAWLAELNTKQCEMKHDKCRNTPDFAFAGQNLAIMSTTGEYTTNKVINGSLKMWFDEYKSATVENIKKVGSPSKGAIGHFTAMVTDRTTEVGCALSTFDSSKGWKSYLMVCNYASTNMIGCPVYKIGSKASGCLKGNDEIFDALCTIEEPINPNDSC